MMQLVEPLRDVALAIIKMPLDPGQRIFWPALVVALVAAVVLRQARPLLSLETWWHPSSRADAGLLFVKTLINALGLGSVGIAATAVALSVAAVIPSYGDDPASGALLLWVAPLYTLVLFVADDVTRFVLHVAMHRLPWLWQFHQVHHSAEVLTPLTLHRSHPVESLLYRTRAALVIGSITGVFVGVYGVSLRPSEVLGINVLGFLFNLLGGNLRHSSVWLSYGPRWERWFVSPAQHQLHHSRLPEHANVNYGTWLAIWDRWWGSWATAPEVPVLTFGVATPNHDPRSVRSLFLGPFAGLGRKAVHNWRTVTTVALLVIASPKLATASEHAALEDELVVVNDEPAEDVSTEVEVETVSIIGSPEAVTRATGSAHQIAEEQLERYNYDDIHRVVAQAPGVYVRGEDGYGLRPNIGLRGANSDRSAKLTLMEDGILLAPAPYAAPAAYYFPLLPRIAGVEVFKGPASIKFGPNTIGGALNLQTRPIPRKTKGHLDLAYGTERFGRLHGYWGTSGERWGLLVEGAHLESAGFKQLDGGGDTGFDRNEIVLRGRYHSDPNARVYHQFDFKTGYADEASRETYLGLSQNDFDLTPNRRYAASQRGLMTWERAQFQVDYSVNVEEHFDLKVTAYRNHFNRDWRKLNRFRGGPDLASILANPERGQTAVFHAILTGAQDSGSANESLLIGTNARDFVSQGINATGHYRFEFGALDHELSFGARFHHDRIRRFHTENGFLMRSGTLVRDDTETTVITQNRGVARAWAFHLLDQIQWRNLTVAPGIRVETIETDFRDRLASSSTSNHTLVALPGIGVNFELLPGLHALAGVHRGFSPVAPGQSDDTQPEDSINYELGARFQSKITQWELVGFLNDYSNLTGTCTLSSGCADAILDQQLNAGSVLVYGAEALIAREGRGPLGTTLRGKAIYTLTLSEFQSSFTSAFPQFGQVQDGDRLPYVPRHQATFLLGASWERFDLDVSIAYVAAQRDVAGQGPVSDAEKIPGRAVVDLASSVQVAKSAQIYVNVRNLFDNSYVVSRRPFGARPGRPLQVLAGLKLGLD